MTEMIKIEKVKTLILPSIRSFEEKVLIPFYGKETETDLQVLNGDLNYSIFVLSGKKFSSGSKILITKEEAENGSYKINFQQKLEEASNEILTKAGFSALPEPLK